MSGVLKWLRLRSRPANDNPPPRSDGLDVLNRDGRLAARTPGNHYGEIFSESGTPVDSVARDFTLTPLNTVIDGETFGLGGYYFEFNASDGTTPSNSGQSPVAAQGSVILTGLPTAADTLVIGATTYTFVEVGDFDAAGEIPLPASGGNYSELSQSIAAAVMGTDGVNTANASASAARSNASTVVITSLTVGTAAVIFTESADNLTIDGSGNLGGTTAGVDPEYFPVDITAYADKSAGELTLTDIAVADDTMTVGATVYTFKALPAVAGEIGLGANALDQAVLVIAAINGTDGRNTANASVSAAGAGGGKVIMTAVVGGDAGEDIVTTETFTPAGNVFDDTTLGAFASGADPVVAEICDAVVAAITAFGAGGSGEVPFTATDGTTDATIISDLEGVTPNGWAITDAFAGTLVQDTAGIAGTAGIPGCNQIDGTNLYILLTADEALEAYVWKKVAHAGL